ncbi:MAG: phenylalanine--tRNA ligase subunit beta, partial [Elusimicrobia bacterium]|nr:phenylalanine--tRNA ligase subunit beta [Elusimicrobiota bacterium]
MKISLNWLKDWLPLELDARELSGRLTSLGFEVSSLEKRGPAFRGVVAAKILEVSKHPNADRLRLCLVDDGTSRLTVVCGAANVAAGQLVPLARVGATLPGGRTLSAAKIRGVESQGMLCSAAELGLSGDHSGILQLPPTPLGGELAETLGPADEVLDVEVTPNRPDCLSHRGLARELAAFLKLPLKQAPASTPPAPAGQCPQVSIEAAKACPLYCARLISGVTVGPSPAWLAAKLEAVGLRPINNVVDVTNYVLLDLGQPLHAFDAARLAGPGLRVRFARAGESLAALDGKPYALSAEILVIADSARPVAIAGVMGGLETGVTEKTTSVILESACFAPPDIRRASRRLRLRSDSSYRFERGVDPEAVLEASERAAALIARLGGKGSSVSAPGIAGAPPPAAKPIQASAERINGLLGSSFPEPQIEACLRGLGRLHPEGPGRWLLAPRSYRRDLESAADLAEEVARLAGYDSIPSQAAPVPPRAAKATPYESLARRCRSRLSAAGLLEACNYDFVCEKTLRLCGLSSAEAPRLANPVSDEWTLLRPSLLPGLLQNAAGNLKHGAAAVKLFELGAQYARRGQAIEERRHLAGLLLGPLRERCWKPELAPDLGFHDAKGLAQDLLS